MRLQTLENIFGADGKDMIVLPFKSYLLEIMDLYQEDKDHLNHIPGYRDYLDQATKQGYGFTVLDKGRPIVCFGIVPQWPGVAELWLIPDQVLIKKHRLRFHKGSLKFMVHAAEELNLHRLHVTVSAHNVPAVKWIESIYFSREGVLKKYSFDKKDMIMYSRIF